MQEGATIGRLPVPLLFVLVADGLNQLLKKTVDASFFKGLSTSRKVVVCNLQYADNTIIFSESNLKAAIILKWVLYYVEVSLGLKINFYKSFMVSLGQRGLMDFVIHHIFGYKLDQFLIKYLGVSIRKGKQK